MKSYIIYNQSGKILRTGVCNKKSFCLQAHEGEFVLEGVANDNTQKIINGKIVDKTIREIKEQTVKVSRGTPRANISKKAWQAVLNRLEILEKNNSE